MRPNVKTNLPSARDALNASSGPGWRIGGHSLPVPSLARLKASVCVIYGDDNQLQFVMLCLMLLLYGPLLWISSKFTPVDSLDFTFNSMLHHLLHGQFYVDPEIVRNEGILRDGHVYVYWGIWCALLRLPLWVVDRLYMDVTVWSCLVAVCLAGLTKVRAVLLLRRQCANTLAANSAICLMLTYILLGGSQIGYLRISVYQEVVFWAYAFAEVFVYFAVKGLVNRNFDLSTLNAMAVCAGLALLTRVSTGVGLLLAIALLMVVLIAQFVAAESVGRKTVVWRLTHALIQPRVLVPVGILVVFVAAAGTVNYFRWGNPLSFAHFGLAVFKSPQPIGVQDVGVEGVGVEGGTFGLSRVPFGLLYYFLPVWVLHGRDGLLVFAQTHTRWYKYVETPPGSILLTDLFPLCFVLLLAVHLWKRRIRYSPAALYAAVLTAGLFLPCLLILNFPSLAYRYRMEFYPLIDLLAFLGLYFTLADEVTLTTFRRRQGWLTVALAVSILSAFVALTLYDFSLSIGRPHELYDRAIRDVYRVVHLLI